MEAKKAGIEKAKNFMRQYRDPESRELKKLSANQFMEVWSHYDQDGELSHASNQHQTKNNFVCLCPNSFTIQNQMI